MCLLSQFPCFHYAHGIILEGFPFEAGNDENGNLSGIGALEFAELGIQDGYLLGRQHAGEVRHPFLELRNIQCRSPGALQQEQQQIAASDAGVAGLQKGSVVTSGAWIIPVCVDGWGGISLNPGCFRSEDELLNLMEFKR